MKVLVPIDGSDCSFRALRFAAEFTRRYEGTLHVVHVTDVETEGTEKLVDRAEEILEEEGIQNDPEIVTDLRMSRPRYSDAVGDDILEMVDEEGYDHVVMGHHGAGRVERIVLGSAAETVVREAEVPATIVN